VAQQRLTHEQTTVPQGQPPAGASAAARRARVTGGVPSEDARFGRERRLRSSADFARVRRARRSFSAGSLTLGVARRTEVADISAAQPAALTRVGFTVGKRVGGAVTRNLVRRRLRELVRRRMRRFTAGWDLVVVARPTAAAATSRALALDLDTLLIRAKVLEPSSEGHSL
jgi:ribonuclease P protein component